MHALRTISLLTLHWLVLELSCVHGWTAWRLLNCGDGKNCGEVGACTQRGHSSPLPRTDKASTSRTADWDSTDTTVTRRPTAIPIPIRISLLPSVYAYKSKGITTHFLPHCPAFKPSSHSWPPLSPSSWPESRPIEVGEQPSFSAPPAASISACTDLAGIAERPPVVGNTPMRYR